MIETTVNQPHKYKIDDKIIYQHNKKECYGEIVDMTVLGGMPAYLVDYDDRREFGGSAIPQHIIFEYQIEGLQ